MNKNKVIFDDDDEDEEMKPQEQQEQNQSDEEKKENEEKKEIIKNQIKNDDKEEKEKDKEKEKILSPKKEIEKPKEKSSEKKIESTPIKKEINKNNNNNTPNKPIKANTEVKINKSSQQKQVIKHDRDINRNDENRNNDMDIEEYYQRERIRKIKASLEKYRIKEEDSLPKKPIIMPNQIKHKKVHKIKPSENISKSNNNNNIIKSSVKKEIKPEIKSEKKILPPPSSSQKENKENKDKEIAKEKKQEKPNDVKNEIIKSENKVINKDLLNKKREREDKEKLEQKEKKIIVQKKDIKKPVEHKKILDDDYDDDDEEDSDYDDEDEDDKSYSDGSSESDEEENPSSELSEKKKKSKPQIHKKIVHSISEKKESGNSSVRKTPLKPKGILVYELLKRWWYALPPWPPQNFDTSEKLKEKKLRLVKISDWKREPKFDKDNLEKCFELPGYKYVYLNNDGKIFDLRPEEGKPSYNNLIKLPDLKLHEHLVTALKGQLAELEKRNLINEKELRKTLKEKLEKEEKTLVRLK